MGDLAGLTQTCDPPMATLPTSRAAFIFPFHPPISFRGWGPTGGGAGKAGPGPGVLRQAAGGAWLLHASVESRSGCAAGGAGGCGLSRGWERGTLAADRGQDPSWRCSAGGGRGGRGPEVGRAGGSLRWAWPWAPDSDQSLRKLLSLLRLHSNPLPPLPWLHSPGPWLGPPGSGLVVATRLAPRSISTPPLAPRGPLPLLVPPSCPLCAQGVVALQLRRLETWGVAEGAVPSAVGGWLHGCQDCAVGSI